MNVTIKPYWGNAKDWPLERITKNWIVVRYNNVATGKYSRKDGYSAGAFKSRQELTPSRVLNLKELNKLADDNGGTYEPKKVTK